MLELKLNYFMIFSRKPKKLRRSHADVLLIIVCSDSRTLNKKRENTLNLS
jgi:hypothetical protein